MDKYKNSDGTYNGVKMLSDLSGLSEGEVSWTFNRLKQLIHDEKKTKQEALKIVKEEAKKKPWLKK